MPGLPALRQIFARRAPQPPAGPPAAAQTDPAWHRTYPALRADHFAPNAGVYFDRSDMLLRLAPEKGLVIGEVGVGLGHFSRFLLDHMQPRIFVAFDLFNLHTMPDVWGRTPEQAFERRTHRAHYEHIFAHHKHRMVIEEGDSHLRLATYAENFFDILYIDADHRYEGVARDAAAAVPLVKPNGLLVFNDYMMCDHLGHAPFGVIPAVHELITTSNWKVVGFSLQPQMYCDIALRRQEAVLF
jgi:hypothetical protein